MMSITRHRQHRSTARRLPTAAAADLATLTGCAETSAAGTAAEPVHAKTVTDLQLRHRRRRRRRQQQRRRRRRLNNEPVDGEEASTMHDDGGLMHEVPTDSAQLCHALRFSTSRSAVSFESSDPANGVLAV